MRCEEIMKRSVECVSPRDAVQSAAEKMRDENVGFLPVCDDDGSVLGAVTDRDLAIRTLAEGRDGTVPVEEIMSREVIACGADEELEEAEKLMAGRHKSRIMCTDRNGKLIGVISLSDIAQREEAERVVATLRAVGDREVRI